MLEKLIQILLLDNHLLITIKKMKKLSLINLSITPLSRKSHWIIEEFDLKEEKKLMFPVDDLINIEPYTTNKRLNKKRF